MAEKVLKTVEMMLPLLMLSTGTWTDIREKKVDVRPILLTGFFGIAGRCLFGNESVPAVFAAAAPGLILLAVTIASRGGIGTGDGLCMLVLGLYYPPEEVWMILFVSLCFGGIIGALLLVRGNSRGASFPFLPCLLAGCLYCEITRLILRQ